MNIKPNTLLAIFWLQFKLKEQKCQAALIFFVCLFLFTGKAKLSLTGVWSLSTCFSVFQLFCAFTDWCFVKYQFWFSGTFCISVGTQVLFSLFPIFLFLIFCTLPIYVLHFYYCWGATYLFRTCQVWWNAFVMGKAEHEREKGELEQKCFIATWVEKMIPPVSDACIPTKGEHSLF